MIAPSEGLPPCVKIAAFEDRAVLLIDRGKCQKDHGLRSRFGIRYGHINRWVESRVHPGPRVPWVPVQEQTDDPDEAQAAFDKGAEYVRTGQLGEAT